MVSSTESQPAASLYRNLAYLELQQQFPDLFTSPATLSTTAQPLYDNDGQLLYNVYVLSSLGKTIATVYTYPDKSHVGVLAQVCPQSQNASLTKSSLMLPTLPAARPLTDGLLDSLLVGFTSAEADAFKESIRLRQQEYRKQVDDYWAAVEGFETELEQATDNDLILIPLTKGGLTIFEDVDEYILEQYNSEAIRKTRWKGGCGPSALANAYRGLYTHYNGMYLPIYGDPGFERGLRQYIDDRAVYLYKNFEDPDGDGAVNLLEKDWVEANSAVTDNGLYADIADFFIYYNAYRVPNISNEWGAALPTDLACSFKRITKGEYYLGMTNDGHEHIRRNHLPLICLKASFTHYFCAIGSRYDTWSWEKVYSLFGKTFTYKSHTYYSKKWLLVTDNGSEMEKHNTLPVWIEDNLDWFALHMAVKKRWY